jgi:DNA repair exonuclease SbcCD ATPase subunit
MSETCPTCSSQPTHESSSTKKKGRLALLWSISGTIVSVIGFVALALFEQYNSMLGELRGDLKHFNEVSAGYVKRESLQKIWEQIKEQSKERQESVLARMKLENELRLSEKTREDLAREVQRMRERLAYVEGRNAGTTTVNKSSVSTVDGDH